MAPPGLVVHLKPGREVPVKDGHPWIFSGAVARALGDLAAPVANVLSAAGEDLGLGFWSPRSQIRVRMLRLPGDSQVDQPFFSQRLTEALALRRAVVPAGTTGYRVVNAEGDGVPGWTVDRFGEVLVSQITVAGLERLREAAYAALAESFPGFAIVQANDLPARRAEGLPYRGVEVIAGSPPLPPAEASFVENGFAMTAELGGGQKTGFYCDQRENRRLAERLAGDREVLDLFAHTGTFGLYALRGGARRVVHVESSPRLIERGRALEAANGFEASRTEWVRANVFADLRERGDRGDRGDRSDRGDRFGLVVCDPPPLVKKRADLDAAARAYKDLNRLALSRVEKGGFLLTFSCSAAVDAKLFRQILFAAAVEAGARVSLLAPLAAAPDHPVSIAHREGEYLKGWLAAVR